MPIDPITQQKIMNPEKWDTAPKQGPKTAKQPKDIPMAPADNNKLETENKPNGILTQMKRVIDEHNLNMKNKLEHEPELNDLNKTQKQLEEESLKNEIQKTKKSFEA